MSATIIAPTHGQFTASRAVLAATAIVVSSAGLISSSAAIRAANEGFSTSTIGLLGSANYAGFFLGALVGPRLVARVGHIRVYSALASVAASFTLLLPLLIVPAAWVVVRFVLGLAMSGIYVVVESWLNSVATNQTRGRLLSVYLVVSNVSFGAGQLLFIATDADTATPFLIASAICSLSVLPLSLSATPAPRHETTHRGLPIRAVFRAAPLAPATSAMSGFGISVITSLGAVYGARTGMIDSEIGIFLAVGSIGGILLQWPIGGLSDRFPRRLVILFTNVAAAAVAGVAGGAGDGSVLIFVALGLYAAISYPLYSLAISHLNDVIEPELRTASAGVLILAYGVGSVTGPSLASLLMDWDAVGFWVSLAASNLIITPYLIYRIVTRRRENKWKHVPFGAETTPAPGMFVNVDDTPDGVAGGSTGDAQPSHRNAG